MGIAIRRDPTGAARGYQRILWLGILCLAVGTASYFLWDRPIDLYTHGLDPTVHAVFRLITQFGESTGYLIISGIGFLVLHFISNRWRHQAWAFAFVFANVAASAVVVDIIKFVLGRARPILLFRENLYGFTWFGPDTKFWSFPSGHAATATSLALSLALLLPRWSPALWTAAVLVMASRVVIDAHYPSDLIGGFFVAFVTYCAVRALFERRGIVIRRKTANGAHR